MQAIHQTIEPISMIRPKRRIVGMSAILLPFLESGEVDWTGFRNHVTRTAEHGLIPAVNMDTGFGNLITTEIKEIALAETHKIMGNREFVAGAFVKDQPGSVFDKEQYFRAIDQIHAHHGTPVIFPSFGLGGLADEETVQAFTQIGKQCSRFIGFELGQQFAPFGKIFSLETYQALMGIKSCIGAKHSSLHREPEWQRLQLRDRVRPDFMVLTGNDLAIDMVMFGSDYLLGLSTFAPDLFARRDAYWHQGHADFYEMNDLLQYLGFFAFRTPVPAYKHSAAQFLKLRQWISCDHTHPASPTRPNSDVAVLREIAAMMNVV